MKMTREQLLELMNMMDDQREQLQEQPGYPLKQDMLEDVSILRGVAERFYTKEARSGEQVSPDDPLSKEDFWMESAVHEFMKREIRHCREALQDGQDVVPFHSAMVKTFNAIYRWTKEHAGYNFILLDEEMKDFNALTDEVNRYLEEHPEEDPEEEEFEIEHPVSLHQPADFQEERPISFEQPADLPKQKAVDPELLQKVEQEVDMDDEEGTEEEAEKEKEYDPDPSWKEPGEDMPYERADFLDVSEDDPVEEVPPDRAEFSEKTNSVLRGSGSDEFEDLGNSLYNYNLMYAGRADAFQKTQALTYLYESSRDYLRKKDTEPFWDSGKERVAAAVEVMAKTSVELLKNPPHMFSKDSLVENMKLECLRSRSFREAMAKNLPALIGAGNRDAYNILRFASQVERASNGRNAIIAGKMPDNDCSRYREARKLLDMSEEEEASRNWEAEAADPAVYKEIVKSLSESILPKVKASEPAPKIEAPVIDMHPGS